MSGRNSNQVSAASLANAQHCNNVELHLNEIIFQYWFHVVCLQGAMENSEELKKNSSQRRKFLQHIRIKEKSPPPPPPPKKEGGWR